VIDVRAEADGLARRQVGPLAHPGEGRRERAMPVRAEDVRHRRPLPPAAPRTVNDDKRRHARSVVGCWPSPGQQPRLGKKADFGRAATFQIAVEPGIVRSPARATSPDHTSQKASAMTRRHNGPQVMDSLGRWLALLVTFAAITTGCSQPPAAHDASGRTTVL